MLYMVCAPCVLCVFGKLVVRFWSWSWCCFGRGVGVGCGVGVCVGVRLVLDIKFECGVCFSCFVLLCIVLFAVCVLVWFGLVSVVWFGVIVLVCGVVCLSWYVSFCVVVVCLI